INVTDKTNFIGTLCADALNHIGEFCGCDWYGDENKTLQAFRHEGANIKYLQTGGNTYVIIDRPTAGARYQPIIQEEGYKWTDDATNLYHNVKVTLGVDETIPRIFDAWTAHDNLYHNTVAGCLLAKNI